MNSSKSTRRAMKSKPDSSGDRQGGSVGERPELARGARDSENKAESVHKSEERPLDPEGEA
jgi:hypothetical protein